MASKEANKKRLVEQTKAGYRKLFKAYANTGRWLGQYDQKVVNMRKTLKSCGEDPSTVEARLLIEAGLPADALADAEDYAKKLAAEAAEEAREKAIREAEMKSRKEEEDKRNAKRYDMADTIKERAETIPKLKWLSRLIYHMGCGGVSLYNETVDEDTVESIFFLTTEYALGEEKDDDTYRFRLENDIYNRIIANRAKRYEYYNEEEVQDCLNWETLFYELQVHPEKYEDIYKVIEEQLSCSVEEFDVDTPLEVFIEFYRNCNYNHADYDDYRWQFIFFNKRIDVVSDLLRKNAERIKNL